MVIAAEAYGRRVGLRVQASDMDALRPWLPYWWVDADVEPERIWDIPVGHAAEHVVSELELWVAEHAEGLIFVHAGVVAFDGKALLLPGRSMSGKSTLVAELLRAGADYGSDEYAPLDAAGLVHPYPRPISLREAAGRRRYAPEEIQAKTLREPVPVIMVAVLSYDPDAGWDVRSESSASTVLRLLANTVSAQARSEEALVALTSIAERGRLVAGTRHEATGAARWLMANLSAGNFATQRLDRT